MPIPRESRIRVGAARLALCALVGWAATGALGAATPEPSGATESSSAASLSGAATTAAQRDLEALRREIAQLEARLLNAQVRSGDSGAEVARLGVELSLQRQRLAEASAARAVAEEAVAATQGQLHALERQRSVQERDQRRAVLALYRLSRTLSPRALLAIDATRDVLAPLRLLRYVARSSRRALEAMRETRRELEGRQRELLARRAEAARWLEREGQRFAELERARRRQLEILETNRREGQLLSGQAQELLLRRGRLERLLEIVTSAEGDLAGRSIHEFRGALGWPASGKVRTEFGPRRDARYGTLVPHHGVELAVTAGSEVRAVYAGRVLYAGAFEDVDNLVVVRHPGQVLTLYGGLAAVRVSRDDVVAFDAVLGIAAETLYVEVRVGQRAEDPRSWLRGGPER